MEGAKLTGLVNGTELFTVQDTTFPEGGYGFYAVKGVWVAFDNFKVWESVETSSNETGKNEGWKLVNVEKRVRFPDDGRTVQVLGKEGNMTVKYHYLAEDPSLYIKESWEWERPPEWIDPEEPPLLTAKAVRLEKKGDFLVEMGLCIDYVLGEDVVVEYGQSGVFGESKTWDVPANGRFEYEWLNRAEEGWLNKADMGLKMARGVSDSDKLVIRIGGFFGPVEHYYFFYIYEWVP